jgi:hypothetical protein
MTELGWFPVDAGGALARFGQPPVACGQKSSDILSPVGAPVCACLRTAFIPNISQTEQTEKEAPKTEWQ